MKPLTSSRLDTTTEAKPPWCSPPRTGGPPRGPPHWVGRPRDFFGTSENAVKTHMVEFAAQRSQARFYIAKAISIGELGKGHRQILIPTREAPWPYVSAVPSETTAKLAIWQETQQLREHRAALVHEPLSGRCKTGLRRQSPFKSRQGKNRRKPLTTGDLFKAAKCFTGH